jgi:16S rRNA (cytosine967-C5)-methyltransferase
MQRRRIPTEKTPAPKISPSRLAAYQVLLRVETRDSYAAELLHSELLKDFSPTDRALATEIVFGVLRWQSKLDANIALASDRPYSKLDVEVRIALRIATYQMLYLERIPSRAAVNESVELVKRARKRSAAPFVNAVLRKLAGAPDATEADDLFAAQHDAAGLAGRYAHPEWLVERWIKNFGAEKAERICQFDQQRPITAIRVSSASAAHQLKREGITLEAGAIVASALRVRSGDITQSTLWREHEVFIQDEASQLVALLVGKGDRMLDCCAAPGGKASAIASRNPHAFIAACELHTHRARKMRELIMDKKIHVVAADAQHLPFRAKFDRVLADLPCSGTGTLARNPEIKWKLRIEDIDDLQSRQRKILEGSLLHLEVGGQLVYSTCSLEPEEGEEVVQVAVREHPELRIVPMRENLMKLRQAGELVWPDVDSLVAEHYLRTFPGIHPCDGFFAAVLERVR